MLDDHLMIRAQFLPNILVDDEFAYIILRVPSWKIIKFYCIE